MMMRGAYVDAAIRPAQRRGVEVEGNLRWTPLPDNEHEMGEGDRINGVKKFCFRKACVYL